PSGEICGPVFSGLPNRTVRGISGGGSADAEPAIASRSPPTAARRHQVRITNSFARKRPRKESREEIDPESGAVPMLEIARNCGELKKLGRTRCSARYAGPAV